MSYKSWRFIFTKKDIVDIPFASRQIIGCELHQGCESFIDFKLCSKIEFS